MSDSLYDVVVIGAGMVGATLASLLSRSGFSVDLSRPLNPARLMAMMKSAYAYQQFPPDQQLSWSKPGHGS